MAATTAGVSAADRPLLDKGWLRKKAKRKK